MNKNARAEVAAPRRRLPGRAPPATGQDVRALSDAELLAVVGAGVGPPAAWAGRHRGRLPAEVLDAVRACAPGRGDPSLRAAWGALERAGAGDLFLAAVAGGAV